MPVEVGKELEFVGCRLSDIVYLAEKTSPVRRWYWPWGWKAYNRSVLRLIAQQAQDAQKYLRVSSRLTTSKEG